MKHDREELLDSLDRLKPALSGTTVPELQHLWCDGKKVLAYDGGLGVKVALDMSFKGGVPGAAVLGMLASSHEKDAVFNGPDKAHAVGLSLGKAHIKLPLLSYERQPWPFPEEAALDTYQLEITEALLLAIQRVLLVKASQPVRAEHHGVIFYPAKRGAYLYTTDDMSVARGFVPGMKLPDDKPLLIPRPFLEQVVRQCEGGKMLVMKDCVLAQCEGLELGSNLLEATDVLDLDAVIAPYLKGEKPAPIPEGLAEALKRALVLAKGDKPLVKLECDGKSMTVSGRYAMGEYTEDVPLAEPVTGEVIARADLVLKLLPEVDSFSITEDASLVLRGDSALVYVLAGAEGS